MAKRVFLNGTVGNDFFGETKFDTYYAGSLGMDTINGGEGYDVAFYKNFGSAITMLPGGLISKGNPGALVGTDQLSGIEEIYGADNQANIIDASSVKSIVSLDVNLAEYKLIVKNIPVYGDQLFVLRNFVNVLGTAVADKIIGDDQNNYFEGRGGKDFIDGGNGNDTILGGSGNDQILGNLGDDFLDGGAGNDSLDGGVGNDIFRGRVGNDTIIGGEGYDVVDYSRLGKAVTILPAGLISKGDTDKDQLLGIEEVIGAVGKANTIDASGVSGGIAMKIDLADNELIVTNIPVYGDQRFTVKNFVNVLGSEGADTIVGSRGDNQLKGNGGNDILDGGAGNDLLDGGTDNDVFRGSVGSDTVVGGEGYDVVDYSLLGKAVTILPAGLINKGGSNKDQLSGIEEVIGAVGKANTINASGVSGGVSLDVNLTVNQLVVKNIPYLGNQNFTVRNFVNVLGTETADTIVGNVQNNNLQGNGGNDLLNGVGGKDTLFGGAGGDTFVLGDANGGFYHNQRWDDYAVIKDFNLAEDKVQLSNIAEYWLTSGNGNSYLYEYTDERWDAVAVLENTQLNQSDLNNQALFQYV